MLNSKYKPTNKKSLYERPIISKLSNETNCHKSIFYGAFYRLSISHCVYDKPTIVAIVVQNHTRLYFNRKHKAGENMLDNLILAYRAQIYDWDFSKWKDFCKKNKMLVIGFGILMLMHGVSIAACIKLKSSFLMLIILLCEGMAAILLDRYAVKQYRQFLLNKQHHLDETISFLGTVLLGKNLFNAEQVEELIARLTKRIESKIPFKGFLTGLSNFAQAVVLPVITYVAGVYSGNLGQLDFVTVTSWAVIVVLLLGIARFAWSYVFTFLRTITCRDYDAAIALREDLLDIKLLYFSNSKI